MNYFTLDNTDGYSASDIVKLNKILEKMIERRPDTDISNLVGIVCSEYDKTIIEKEYNNAY